MCPAVVLPHVVFDLSPSIFCDESEQSNILTAQAFSVTSKSKKGLGCSIRFLLPKI